MPITYLSQRDPRWAKVKIGNSRLTVGDWGCTLTNLCMLFIYIGIPMTPDKLARMTWLFTPDGLLNWSQVERASGGKLKFVERVGGRLANGTRIFKRDDKKIKASIVGSPKTFVILEVNYGKHWVWGLSVTPDGKDYWVADPIDGKRKQLLKAYPNITGSAHFTM